MATRRGFLATLLAGAALPSLSWADAGGPAYVAAAREPDGSYALYGLSADGEETFGIALPARGHAAAAHPFRPEAVAFARRPGTFALVIDCARGVLLGQLEAPEGHHFNGHGAFSSDGHTLFTSETDNLNGEGQIGVWNAAEGYARQRQFASGGIGPHEILRLPGTDVLAVANGGIHAALDNERTKLNLATMAPNLSYFSDTGALLEQVTLPPDLHQNSIRHLAAHSDGTLAFAMQWEGDAALYPPLLGLHRRGETVVLHPVADHDTPRTRNYAGSVAFSNDGARVGITCSKGGVLAVFDLNGGAPTLLPRRDVSGLACAPEGMIATDGMGGVLAVTTEGLRPLGSFNRAWDNHLVAIQTV